MNIKRTKLLIMVIVSASFFVVTVLAQSLKATGAPISTQIKRLITSSPPINVKPVSALRIDDGPPSGYIGSKKKLSVIIPDNWSPSLKNKAMAQADQLGAQITTLQGSEDTRGIIILLAGIHRCADIEVTKGRLVGQTPEMKISGTPKEPAVINVTGTCGLSNYVSLENATINVAAGGKLLLKDNAKITKSRIKLGPGATITARGAPHTISMTDSYIECDGYNASSETIESIGFFHASGSATFSRNEVNECDIGVYVTAPGTNITAERNTFTNTKLGIMFTCGNDDDCYSDPPSGEVHANVFEDTKIGIVVNAGVPEVHSLNDFDSGTVEIGILNASPHTFASAGGDKLNAVLNYWFITGVPLNGSDSRLSDNIGDFDGDSFPDIYNDDRMPKNVVEIYADGASTSNRPRTTVSCSLAK